MKNNKKMKFLMTIIISLSITMAALGGLFYAQATKSDNVVYARTAIESPIAVKRIYDGGTLNKTSDDTIYQTSLEDEKLGNVSFSEENKDPNIKPIKNGELILVEEGNSILVSFNVNEITSSGVDTINSDITYYTLSVNAYLNGKAIVTNEQQDIDNNNFFYQYLFVNNEKLTFLNGDEIESNQAEGHYKFIFAFSEKDANNSVSSLITKEIDFYAYKASTYASTNERKTAPKLYNTEIVSRDLTKTDVQENYFNFNNINTKDYYGESTPTDKLYYPTISYDATKYTIKIKRNLYENYNIFEFKTILENDLPIVKVYKNGNLLTNEQLEKETSFALNATDVENIYDIVFNDIGEYEITYNYIIEQREYDKQNNTFTLTGYITNPADLEAENDLKENASFVKENKWDIVGNNKLYIFGYQLQYSDYSNAEQSANKEFKSSTKTTDLTFLNTEIDNEDGNKNKTFRDENLKGETAENICSTNQAPVSLAYYSRMTTNDVSRLTNSYAIRWDSYEDYVSGLQGEKIAHITNNTKFINNGYYQLFIEYTFESYKKANGENLVSNSNTICHYQFFSFAIKNSEPIITVKNQDEQVLNSNGYTNKNIHITWEANTEFDIEPRVKIQKRDYNSTEWTSIYGLDSNNNYVNSAESFIIKNSDNYLSILANGSNDGEYQVILNYGPGKNTLVKYKFNIDTESLENKIKLYSVLSGTTVNNIIDSDIINSAFTLNWQSKQSGAKITASYDYIPLELDASFDAYNNINVNSLGINQDTKITDLVNVLSALEEINLWNGYTLKNVNQNIPYENAILGKNADNDDVITNSSTIRTSAGYYIFTIKDEAGNQTTKTIFVDNTKPVIYSYTEKETSYVAIEENISKLSSRDTIVVWGNNKVIKIDESIKHLFDNSNELLVPINNVQSISLKGEYETKILNRTYQVFHIKGSEWNDGDKTHTITIKDLSNISTINKNNARVYDNSLEYQLRMNSDNSVLMAYLSDDGTNFDEIRSDISKFGTGNKLYLEWIQNEGNEFEVKSVKYYYYPLTFEENSPNYPYASNYSKVEEINFETLATSLYPGHSDKVMTGELNVQFGQSLEGMYIVKREYHNSLSADENETGDYSPRYYVFFIDRNKVISYSNSNNFIGEEIGLNIGSNSKAGYQVEFGGEDFLYDTSSNLKFTTSKLPIRWIKSIESLNKFSVQLDSNSSSLILEGEDTNKNINSLIHITFKLVSPTILYSATVPNGTDDSNYTSYVYNFNKNGYYKAILSDHAENEITNYEFFFRINVEEPRANIIRYVENELGHNEYLSYSEGETGISSNSTNMLLVWNKPADVTYDAEIDKANFTVLITFENGDTVDFVTTNNILSSSTAVINNSRIYVYDMENDDKFENATWDYYIDYAEIFDLIKIYYPQYKNQSARVDITLNYIGSKSDYELLGSSKYFETTKTVVFDFEKPNYNFNRLYSSDLYLNNLDISIQDFETENSLINFENYAFTVDSSFTLNRMIPQPNSIWSDASTDTYKIFYREYDKYADETISNQQSIVPTDARFDNLIGYPNRYRFDENLTIDSQKIYADISAYYWNKDSNHYYTLLDMGLVANKFYEIIEVDFAGNYRIYTIFVKDNNSTKTEASFTLQNSGSDTVVDMNSDLLSINRYETDVETNETLLYNKDELLAMIDSTAFEKMFGQIYNMISIENINEVQNKKFITIKVENITQNLTSLITLAPNGDKASFIADFNNLIAPYNNQTGNIYYITIITSQNEILKIEHRKPNQEYPDYSIVDGSIGFTISFNVKVNDANSSSYIKYFEAYRADKGIPTSEPLTNDSNGLSIIADIESYILEKGDEQNFSYTFKIQGSSGSEYLITLVDNFNREIKIRKIIGVTDNADKLVFNAPNDKLVSSEAVDDRQNVTIVYTNESVSLKFQNVLYSVDVYNVTRNGNYLTIGEKVEIGDDSYNKLINGIWTYNLITNQTENDTIYKVVFKSTQGELVYYVGYHTELANIIIKKASDGSEIAVLTNQNYTFDKMVFVNIKDYANLLFPVTIEIVRTYEENGNIITQNLGEVENGYPISELGDYQITIYNQLGTQINFNIKMIEKITESFWINYKVGGVEAGILTYTNKSVTDIGTMSNPYEYFTIYDYVLKTNTSGNYAYELVETIEYNGATTKLYKIYRTFMEDGESVIKDEKYVKVSVIPTNSNFLRTSDNSFAINNQIMDKQNDKTISQDQENKTKTAILSFARNYNIIENNNIILSIYYNNVFVKSLDLSTLDNNTNELTFVDSGVYDFYFQDIAGNKQKFGNSQYFRMILLNDVLFNVNSKQAVNNQVFNGEVKIALLQVAKFDNSLITLTVRKNGKVINSPSKINNTFTFKQDEYGLYNITLTGYVNEVKVSTDYTFRIINSDATMSTFEYSGLNNYEITKVVKYATKTSDVGVDITKTIKEKLELSTINVLAISSLENGLGGAGYYEITVKANYTTNKPSQTFSFNVWLNNDNDINSLIQCSIPYGTSTTKEITFVINYEMIYNKIGECKIMRNNEVIDVINAEKASQAKGELPSITANGTYNIRIVTNSGNTLGSFVVTKTEPLNAVAIIVIVISVLAVGAITFIFIKLRKNMKVK